MQDSQGEAKTPEIQHPVSHRHGFLYVVTSIALLLAILSLAANYFFYWIYQQKIDPLLAKNQQIDTYALSKLGTVQTELNAQKSALQTLLTKSQKEEKKQSVLPAQQAEFLLTLAQYNLLYEGNLELASKLMTEASRRISQISDPNIYSITQIINNQLKDVLATQAVDITSILSQLSALSDQVTSLSALPVLTGSTQINHLAKPNLNWKQKLMITLESLKGILSIRRLPEPVTPLASGEQQFYITETIRFKLMQAQWAVLHHNPTLYQESLQQAKNQLQKFYARNKVGAEILQKIDQLSQINIKPPVPDLSHVIGLLQSYIQSAQVTDSTVTEQVTSPPPAVTQTEPQSLHTPSQTTPRPPPLHSNPARALPS